MKNKTEMFDFAIVVTQMFHKLLLYSGATAINICRQVLSLTIVFVLLTTRILPAQYNQLDWRKYENNPVLDVGSPGAWDAGIVSHHEILFDGSVFKMWYTGIPHGSIGLATSSNGIDWTKYDGNPVMTGSGSGVWDSLFVGVPVIIRNDTTYKMWYNGGRAGFAEVGFATSQDGISWEKHGDPVLQIGTQGTWDARVVAPCEIIFDGATYKMWYAGADESFTVRIGLATSPDGINWTKFAGNPVFEPGVTGSWDDAYVYTPDIILEEQSYQMWYMGNDGMTIRIGYATSSDGINWTKDDHNPILNIGENGTWDDTGVGHPRVIRIENTYRMWFIGEDGSNTRIGYAMLSPSSITEDRRELSPIGFSLAQNYPNPFNPVTWINFDLPETEFIELSIYNPVGQLVETLVYEKKGAGFHSIRWNASALSSGIYFYKIRAGQYSAVKKALLLK